MRAGLLLLALACGDDPAGDSAGADGLDGGADGADGATSDDADEDGFTVADGDCDDADAAVFPGAEERCNGLDDDCDGAPHPEEGDGGADCAACDSSGWWGDAREVDDTLPDRVDAALQGDVCSDYDRARDGLFQLEADGGTVTCLYTGRTFSLAGGVDFDEVNAEHAWPRSDGAAEEPPECDLHHLFVTDALANSRRGNHPFGVVSSSDWSDGGSQLGDDSGGRTVFEPRDDAKGDIARAMLYFHLKYGATLTPEAVDKHLDPALFASWHAADPPDPSEQQRSITFADFQSGRANPFVVCPWLVPALVE